MLLGLVLGDTCCQQEPDQAFLKPGPNDLEGRKRVSPRDVAWNDRIVHTGIWKVPVNGPVMARDGDGQGRSQGARR